MSSLTVNPISSATSRVEDQDQNHKPQGSFWAKHKVTILTGTAVLGVVAIAAVATVAFPPAAILPYLAAVGISSGAISPMVVAAGILAGLSAFTAGITGGLIDYKRQQYRQKDSSVVAVSPSVLSQPTAIIRASTEASEKVRSDQKNTELAEGPEEDGFSIVSSDFSAVELPEGPDQGEDFVIAEEAALIRNQQLTEQNSLRRVQTQKRNKKILENQCKKNKLLNRFKPFLLPREKMSGENNAPFAPPSSETTNALIYTRSMFKDSEFEKIKVTKPTTDLKAQLIADFKRGNCLNVNGVICSSYEELEKQINFYKERYHMSEDAIAKIYDSCAQTAYALTARKKEGADWVTNDPNAYLPENGVLKEVSEVRYFYVEISQKHTKITLSPLISSFTIPDSEELDPNRDPYITCAQMVIGHTQDAPVWAAYCASGRVDLNPRS